MDATLANLAGVTPEEVVTEIVAEEPTVEELQPEEGTQTLGEYVLEQKDTEAVNQELEKRAEELGIELPDPEIKSEEQIEEEHAEVSEEIVEALDEGDGDKLKLLVERLMDNYVELEKKLTRENAVLTKTITILEAENNQLVEENAKMKYGKKTGNAEIDEYSFLLSEFNKDKTKETAKQLLDYHLKQVKIFYPEDFDINDTKKKIQESNLRRLAAISGQPVSAAPTINTDKPVNPNSYGVPIKR